MNPAMVFHRNHFMATATSSQMWSCRLMASLHSPVPGITLYVCGIWAGYTLIQTVYVPFNKQTFYLFNLYLYLYIYVSHILLKKNSLDVTTSVYFLFPVYIWFCSEGLCQFPGLADKCICFYSWLCTDVWLRNYSLIHIVLNMIWTCR